MTLANTALGALQGTQEKDCTVFRSVPYAAPPVGRLRFAPTEPVAAWGGVRAADRHGPVAPQPASDLSHYMGDFVRPQSEDCLTLTIWTPAVDAGRRPVLLWLHGGAFVSGAGSLDWYSGARLAMAGDLVVVHANYRLGALGWLCWPGAAPGNMALSDQAMALRWVRDHITAFGGDPDRITLGGQSAGATTAARLMLDPALQPMVQRVLLQSGGFGRDPSSKQDAAPTAQEFLQALSIDPDGPDVAAQLRAAPLPDILRAQMAADRFGFTLPIRQQAWRPLLDQATTLDGLLTATGAALAGKDVLVGFTAHEGHAFVGGPIPADPPADAVAERFLRLTGDPGAQARYQAARPGATPGELLGALVSDYQFIFASLGLADQAAAHGARTHVYAFEWSPPASRFGAGHCIDLAFSFANWPEWLDAPMLSGGDPATMGMLAKMMQQAVASFVRHGVPVADHAATLGWLRPAADGHAVRRADRRGGRRGRVCAAIARLSS